MTDHVAEAGRFRVFELRTDYDNRGLTWVDVRCKCSTIDSVHVKPNMPANEVANKFRARGWKISSTGKRATCPECQKTMPNPTPNVIVAERAMYKLLDDHYDVASSSYLDNWTDKKIAGEVGLSPDRVSEVREAAYGPLRDPKVDASRVKLAVLESKVAEEIAGLQELIDSLKKHVDSEIGKIHATLQSR